MLSPFCRWGYGGTEPLALCHIHRAAKGQGQDSNAGLVQGAPSSQPTQQSCGADRRRRCSESLGSAHNREAGSSTLSGRKGEVI